MARQLAVPSTLIGGNNMPKSTEGFSRERAAYDARTTRTIIPKGKVPNELERERSVKAETVEDPELDKKIRQRLVAALRLHDPDFLDVWEEQEREGAAAPTELRAA